MFGNTGRIAKIDLSEGKVEDLFLPEDLYRAFIGGSGLAAKLFSDMADMSADALSPEALLLFLNGPLAGVKLSGASRFSAAGVRGRAGVRGARTHRPGARRCAAHQNTARADRRSRPAGWAAPPAPGISRSMR